MTHTYMNKDPDIVAEVTLLHTEEGGRAFPGFSGYRPLHLVREDYLTSGEHEYIGQDCAPLGETVLTYIRFLSPEVYPKSLWVGKVMNIQQGRWVVGHAKVIEILNPILDRDNQSNH